MVFTFSYLTHLVGDFYPILYLGTEYYFFPNLFWPLVEPNPDLNPSFGAHFERPLSVFLVAIELLGIIICYTGIRFLWRFKGQSKQ